MKRSITPMQVFGYDPLEMVKAPRTCVLLCPDGTFEPMTVPRSLELTTKQHTRGWLDPKTFSVAVPLEEVVYVLWGCNTSVRINPGRMRRILGRWYGRKHARPVPKSAHLLAYCYVQKGRPELTDVERQGVNVATGLDKAVQRLQLLAAAMAGRVHS